jgi:hypothetical protein
MTRLRCLVFDANVVIALFERGLWQAVLSRCELVLAQTVVGEADFYVDHDGVRHTIDLQPDIDAGRVRVVSIGATRVAAFQARFDPLYVQKLDPGETESLVFCLAEGQEYLLCSSDAVVFRVLAQLDRTEQGVSLEEVLASVGLGRPLDRPYTKSFRKEFASKGLQDRLAGMGLKK